MIDKLTDGVVTGLTSTRFLSSSLPLAPLTNWQRNNSGAVGRKAGSFCRHCDTKSCRQQPPSYYYHNHHHHIIIITITITRIYITKIMFILQEGAIEKRGVGGHEGGGKDIPFKTHNHRCTQCRCLPAVIVELAEMRYTS